MVAFQADWVFTVCHRFLQLPECRDTLQGLARDKRDVFFLGSGEQREHCRSSSFAEVAYVNPSFAENRARRASCKTLAWRKNCVLHHGPGTYLVWRTNACPVSDSGNFLLHASPCAKCKR